MKAGYLILVLAAIVSPSRHSASTESGVQAGATITVSISTRNPTSLEPGFAGYNLALMAAGIEYTDERLLLFARKLYPGWLRYPAGAKSDAFDWRTGLSRQSWVDRFIVPGNPAMTNWGFYPSLRSAHPILAGKGGDRFDDAVRFADSAGAVGLIICVNAYTDTPESAGAFAAYARSHGIKVLAWQLANEPYARSLRSFFLTAPDYAAQMQPFAATIKAADPSARISLFASNASFPDTAWDNALAAFQPRYWDLLTYHQYPLLNTSSVADMIPQLNTELAANSSDYVESQIVPRFGQMPILITEADPGLPGSGTPQPGVRNMYGTLYGGIWAAEYVLRLSKLPQVKHVGMHQLIGPGGVDMANNHIADVVDAYRHGATLDTRNLDFGLFVSAQGEAYSLAAGAINSASQVYPTAITGGSPAPVAGAGQTTPAVYAQAYGDRPGRFVAVVTNKGEHAESLAIRVDGSLVAGPFQLAVVTGPGPSAMNTLGQPTVKQTTSVVQGLVPVPPYSVVRIAW